MVVGIEVSGGCVLVWVGVSEFIDGQFSDVGIVRVDLLVVCFSRLFTYTPAFWMYVYANAPVMHPALKLSFSGYTAQIKVKGKVHIPFYS